MPNKKVNIGGKPTANANVENLDQWVLQNNENYTDEQDSTEKKPIKMKRLTLDIPETLHKAIKTKAVAEGVAMVDMLRELLAKEYGNDDLQK